MSKSRGFLRPPLGDIQRLRELLKEAYPIESIFRELIQNASDAGAKTLRIHYIPSDNTRRHPLLKLEAVLVVNDGPFNEQHDSGIQSLGISTKGGNADSVGRFGLGMKGIFHWCDAFFYGASEITDAEGKGKGRCLGLLNPWTDTDCNKGWEEFTAEDQEKIYEIITNQLKGCEFNRWFALWIPLRCKGSYEGNPVPSKPYFPDAKDIFKEDRMKSTAAFLPLLRSLQSVEFCGPQTTMLIRAEPDRKERLACLEPGKSNPVSGSIKLGAEEMRFAGIEKHLDDETFKTLRQTNWPACITIDKCGKDVEAQEKNIPHAAVVFGSIPKTSNNHSRLEVQESVFLPIAESQSDSSLKVDLGKDYSLWLHGYYFVRSDRKSLFEKDPDGSTEEQWNYHLYRKGVLPLLIPALDLFMSTHKVPSEHIDYLVKKIDDSNLWRLGKEEICQDCCWIYQVEANQQSWRIMLHREATTEYYEVPKPPAGVSYSDLFALFPALENKVITFEESGRLSQNSPSQWSQDLITSAVFDELLEQPDRVRFAKILFRACFFPDSAEMNEAASAALAQALSKAIGGKGFSGLNNEVKKELLGLIDLVREEHIICWDDGSNPNVRRALSALMQLGLSKLIVTPDLKSEKKKAIGKFALADAETILRWVENKDRRTRQTIAIGLLKHSEISLDSWRKNFGSRRLFLAVSGGQEIEVSLNDLSKKSDHNQLFSSEGTLITKLSEVVDGIWQIEKDLAALIDQRSCRYGEALGVLSRRPTLRPDLRARQELLSCLVEDQAKIKHEAIAPLRYLIHGQRARYGSTEMLFYSEEGTDIWRKILTHVKRDNAWTFVEKAFAQHLSPEQQGHLDTSRIDRETVIINLEEMRTDAMPTGENPFLGLGEVVSGEEDRITVLAGIEDGFDDLWKALPLHRSPKGTVLPIGPAFFRPSNRGFQVHESLASMVEIIEVPSGGGGNQAKIAELKNKYNRLLPEWTPVQAIKASLQQAYPHAYCDAVMGALGELDHEGIKDIRERLAASPWLPTRDGGAIAPKQIIHLPEIHEYLRRVDGRQYLLKDDLRLDDEKMGLLMRLGDGLFLKTLEAIATLGKSLADLDGYGIGVLSDEDHPLNILNDGLPVFRSVPNGNCPKGWAFLSHVEKKLGRNAASDLADCLSVSISEASIKETLALAATCCQSSNDQLLRDSARKVHFAYLSSLIAKDDFGPETLRGLQLLNRKGDWRDVSGLTFGLPNISDSDLLCVEHAEMLRGKVDPQRLAACVDSPQTQPRDGIEEGRAALKRYFDGWNQDRIVGLFFALLGDNEPRQIACDYLRDGQLTIDAFRGGLVWDDRAPGWAPDWQKMDVHVQLLPADLQVRSAVNLLGEPFDARIPSTLDTLLSDQLQQARDGSWRCKLIRLNPREYEGSQLNDILRQTVTEALDVMIGRCGNLQAEWQRLSEEWQLDIKVSQRMIAQNMLFYIRELNGEKLEELKKLSGQWDELRRQAEETARLDEIQGKIRELYDKLRDMLEGPEPADVELRRQLLEAVKTKIADFRYTETSIPFELFQNADDASKELERLEERSGEMSFEIQSDRNEYLRFIHFGRRINQYSGRNLLPKDGKKFGFHADLEKMLIMSASDKGEAGDSLTGKFGLGFKSSYLFADEPRIISGTNAFFITGGMYPIKLLDDDMRRLREYSQRRTDATIIELKRRHGGSSCREVLRSFMDRLPQLLAFSRKIKTCRINETAGNGMLNSKSYSWSEVALNDVPHAYVGECRIDQEVKFKSLVFRKGSNSNLAFLIPIGESGICEAAGMPLFWVTAPIGEEQGFGLAINADFAVDAGRRQMALENLSNNTKCDKMGGFIGKVLVDLFDASADAGKWDAIKAQLGFEGQLDLYSFWEEIWGLSTRVAIQNQRHLYQMLWSDDRGMKRLLLNEKRHAMPSGLGGQLRRLVSADVREICVLSGLLMRDEARLGRVMEWGSFGSCRGDKNIASARNYEKLAVVLSIEQQPLVLDLSRLLACEFGDRVARPEQVQRVGMVVDQKLIAELEETDEGRKELSQIRIVLEQLRFESQEDGELEIAANLMISGGDVSSAEEQRIAAFAPPERVLGAGYSSMEAVGFFGIARALWKPPEAGDIVKWGRQLSEEQSDKRQGFIDYLLCGDQRNEVARLVRQCIDGTWLEDMVSVEALTRLGVSETDQMVILGMLGCTPDQLQEVARPVAPEVDTNQSKEELAQLLATWRENREGRVTEYESIIYPENYNADRIFSDILDTGLKGQKAWLTLLLRAAMETMGRCTNNQHRSFLELCERQGWLDALADHTQRDAADIIADIDEHLSEQADYVKYWQWLKQIFILLFIRLHLDEYIASLRSAEAENARECDLARLLCPNVNVDLEGTGSSTSPLENLLGIGKYFLIRELKRKNVLRAQWLDQYCFVPNQRLRNEIQRRIGQPAGNSEDIYSALQALMGDEFDLTFCGDYDIALRMSFNIEHHTTSGSQFDGLHEYLDRSGKYMFDGLIYAPEH